MPPVVLNFPRPASDFEHHCVPTAILPSFVGAVRSAVRARSDLILKNLALRRQPADFKKLLLSGALPMEESKCG
jgi:hypothetical protein